MAGGTSTVSDIPSQEEDEELSFMQCLPFEIVEIIASEESLSIKDVVNLSSTCRQLREAVSSNQNIWKSKFNFTWPNTEGCLDKTDNLFIDWLECCKYRQSVDIRVTEFLDKLSTTIYWRNISISPPDFDKITKIAYEKGATSFDSVLDSLITVYNNSYEITIDRPDPSPGRFTLTNRFYASAAIEHLRHIRQEMQWHKICSNPTTATPEIIATFFSQWINTPVKYHFEDTEKQIDDLTEQIKANLEKSHPIHKAPWDLQRNWADGYLTLNQWPPKVCQKLLEDISHNLFKILNFKNSSTPTAETFFIDRVVGNRAGHTVILTILYEAIARRLGVRCNIVCFSTHLFITWQDTYEAEGHVYYLDIETGKLRGSRGRCPYSNAEVTRESYRKYSHTSLLLFLTNQYQCAGRDEYQVREREVSCTELLSIIHPTDPECLLNLAETYENHNKYVDTAYEKLRTLLRNEIVGIRHPVLSYLEAKLSTQDMNVAKVMVAKHHPAEVTYAVGMVCYHMEFQYTCVIRGWDVTCMATNEWQERMQVYRLSRGATQPFYHCIAEDGTERYVAQENLTAVVPTRKRLTYIEDLIGYQFSHYDGFCYIPNAQMEMEYPDDGNWRRFYQTKIGFAASFNCRR